jgi:hypothetical protein
MWQTLDGSIHLGMKCVNSVIAYTIVWRVQPWLHVILVVHSEWENELSVNIFA